MLVVRHTEVKCGIPSTGVMGWKCVGVPPYKRTRHEGTPSAGPSLPHRRHGSGDDEEMRGFVDGYARKRPHAPYANTCEHVGSKRQAVQPELETTSHARDGPTSRMETWKRFGRWSWRNSQIYTGRRANPGRAWPEWIAPGYTQPNLQDLRGARMDRSRPPEPFNTSPARTNNAPQPDGGERMAG